jgi:hypothetical protein
LKREQGHGGRDYRANSPEPAFLCSETESVLTQAFLIEIVAVRTIVSDCALRIYNGGKTTAWGEFIHADDQAVR